MGVEDAWDRIEAWLKEHARDMKKSLKTPAKLQDVRKFESAVGVTLPADFIASLARHNGQSENTECGLFPYAVDDTGGEPAWRLLSVKEIISTWNALSEVLDAGNFADLATEPVAGVRPDWWCPGWIPFADNGGSDALCLDMTPAAAGQVGQVIIFQHAAPARLILAGSFEALLTRLAEDLESAKYIYDSGQGLVKTDHESSGKSGKSQRDTDRFLHLVILLPVERPTTDQLKVVKELSHQQHANLLEVRELLRAGGFSEFGRVMSASLERVVSRLEQVGIPYRLQALPPDDSDD